MESERSLAEAEQIDAVAAEPQALQKPRNTRKALLDAALDHFSTDGYAGTSIRDLASTVGIRESSVYKHFASKQEIFEALIDRADEQLAMITTQPGAVTETGTDISEGYRDISEERLLAIARSMFDFVVESPYFTKLRRFLMIEQYRNADVSLRLHEVFIERPLAFQTAIFRDLISSGEFREGLDPELTALSFYGPIYLLVQHADSDDSTIQTNRLLAGHVRQFRMTHLKEQR